MVTIVVDNRAQQFWAKIWIFGVPGDFEVVEGGAIIRMHAFKLLLRPVSQWLRVWPTKEPWNIMTKDMDFISHTDMEILECNLKFLDGGRPGCKKS